MIRTKAGSKELGLLAAGFVLLAVMLSSSPAGAFWLAPERLTNDPASSMTSPNNARCVTFDSAGYIHVVWTDYRYGYAGVFHKFFDGSAWNPDSLVSLPGASAYDPSVASDAAGKIHAAWTDHRDGNSEIYYRSYDGVAWAIAERISSNSSTSSNPSVAAGDSGDIHIVWQDFRDSDWEVYYRGFDGATWSSEQRLTNHSGTSLYASVAVGSDGTVHVAWQDSRDGNYEIYYKMYDGSWSSDMRLTSDTGSSEQPSITVDADGNPHVVWADDRDGAWEIYHKVRTSGVWGSDERLTYETAASTGPSVAADDSGGVHVVWKDERHGNEEIYYRSYDGLAWGAEDRMTNDDGPSKHPSIAAGSGMAMVWQDRREGNSEIYAYRFEPGPFPPPVLSSITPAVGDSGTVVVTDLAGDAFLHNTTVFLKLSGEPDLIATDIAVKNAQEITCELDLTAAAGGFWDVVAENPDGQRDTLPNAFGVWPWPDVTVTSVAPSEGYPGQHIDGLEILGYGFISSARVWLQKLGYTRVQASDVVVHSAFRVTCAITLPDSGIGLWDVVVDNVGHAEGALQEGFLLTELEAPEIVSIYPFEGVAGDHMNISDLAGDNFYDPATVWLQNNQFGVVPAENIVVESPEKITCEFDLPGAVWGDFDVVVMQPSGLKDTLGSAFHVIQGEWGEDMRLTDAPGASNLSRGNARCIAADALGNIHAVWFDERNGNSEIYYRMHDGVTWGTEERITTAANESENPAIAVDSNNTVYIFWADRMSGDWQIYYILKDFSGWSDIQCLTDAGSVVNYPSAAIDTNDDIHVVWQALSAPSVNQIIYRRTQNSAWLAPDTLSRTSEDQQYPAIAIDGSNTVHVTWRETSGGSYCMKYTKWNGAFWEPDTSLVCREGMGAPTLCADADGKLHLAFRDRRFGNSQVFYKPLDGTRWLPAIRISDTSASSIMPSVVSDGAGEVAVVWSDDRNNAGAYEIYSRCFDGASWQPETRLTYASGTSSIYPSAALDMAGALHVIWSDQRDGNFEIYHKVRGEDASAGAGGERFPQAHADLLQVVPNPFRGSVEFRPVRAVEANTVISIYDVTGRLVWNTTVPPDPGSRTGMTWDGRTLYGQQAAPGIYILRLKSPKQTAMAKIVRLK